MFRNEKQVLRGLVEQINTFNSADYFYFRCCLHQEFLVCHREKTGVLMNKSYFPYVE